LADLLKLMNSKARQVACFQFTAIRIYYYTFYCIYRTRYFTDSGIIGTKEFGSLGDVVDIA
jgi:hypothetical protein